MEFAYGDVYARPGLDLRERELSTVAALAAQGDTAAQLDFHIDAALHVGVQPEEVIEALIHIVPFMGFPRRSTRSASPGRSSPTGASPSNRPS